MNSLHYIIATYSGIYRENENKEYVLQKQLEFLYDILVSKRKQGLPCLLKRITIVCPRPRHQKIYTEYYQKEKWEKIFTLQFPNIQLVFLDYIGDNNDHSYDQWIQGYMSCMNCDYNLFMEDDYCVNPKNVMFDKDLIDLYKSKFPDNIGYLSTLASNNNGHRLHASISNGLISSDTFKMFDDPLKTYYNMVKTEPYPQLKFSYMFTNNNILLADITDKYQALFWNSVTLELVNFSPNNEEIILCPVQALGVNTIPGS